MSSSISSISVAFHYPPSLLDGLQNSNNPLSPAVSRQNSQNSPSLNTNGNSNVNVNWSSGSPDLIRVFFRFVVSAPSLYLASSVCKSWQKAIDHPSVWTALSHHYQWPSNGKAAFIEKYIATRIYKRSLPTQSFIEDGRSGFLALFAPSPIEIFNWKTGRRETENADLLVAATSAPRHSLSVFHVPSKTLCREETLSCPEERRNVQWSAIDISEDGKTFLMADSQTPTIFHFQMETNKWAKFNAPNGNAVTAVKQRGKTKGKSMQKEMAKSKESKDSPIKEKEKSPLRVPSIRSLPFDVSPLCVSGGYDKCLSVWNPLNGQRISVLNGGNDMPVWSVDVHPNRPVVAAGSDDDIVRIFVVDERVKADEKKAENPLIPPPRIAGGAPPPPPPPPKTEDVGGYLFAVLRGHSRCPMVVKFDPFDPDGAIYTAGYDADIRQWKYDGGELKTEGAKDKVKVGELTRLYKGTNTVFSLEILQHVVIGSLRGNLLRIYDKETVECLRVLTVGAIQNPAADVIYGMGVHATTGHASIDVKCVSVSPDGLVISAGNTAGGICQWRFHGHEETAAAEIAKQKEKNRKIQSDKDDEKDCRIM